MTQIKYDISRELIWYIDGKSNDQQFRQICNIVIKINDRENIKQLIYKNPERFDSDHPFTTLVKLANQYYFEDKT